MVRQSWSAILLLMAEVLAICSRMGRYQRSCSGLFDLARPPFGEINTPNGHPELLLASTSGRDLGSLVDVRDSKVLSTDEDGQACGDA